MKRILSLLLACVLLCLALAGCTAAQTETQAVQSSIDDEYRTWYEVFVREFYDSDGDGIGDLAGVEEKLDYISSLGFNGIWLMPIMPSTSYHKYDVDDYMSMDTAYGTIQDLASLIKACHERGIRIIIDMPLNHTSVANKWFLSAKASFAHAPCGQDVCAYDDLCPQHNPCCAYYHFDHGTPGGTWYSLGVDDIIYEGAFWEGMPDLNLENDALFDEIDTIFSFWLQDMDVDGFRFDGVKEFVSGSAQTNAGILKKLVDICKGYKPDAYTVAEVWEDETTVAGYYSSGVTSCFDFTYAGTQGSITKIVNQSGEAFSMQKFAEHEQRTDELLHAASAFAVDAPFFTNHDMARAAGYFAGDLDKLKYAWALSLTMSGSSFMYYGEELGMAGSGKDENKRAPMLWSAQDLTGMCEAPPGMEPQSNRYAAADEQSKDPQSLCNYVRKVISLRNTYPQIARGHVQALPAGDNCEVAAVEKTWNEETILLVYNGADSNGTFVLPTGYMLADSISTNGEVTKQVEGELQLPAYTIAVCTKTTEG